MKVLLTIKKLRYSGAYKMFMWVAKGLADKGFDITVYTYMQNDIEHFADNVHWIKDKLDTASFPTHLRALRKVIKDVQPAYCISFLLDANLLNTLACMGTSTKSVICERNDPFKPGYYKLQLTKWIFRWADGAVFQLPKVQEYYSMIKGRTAVIPNPVPCIDDDIDMKPIAEREKLIVTLGRIDMFQKRQDVLLNAFYEFWKTHQDYRLEMYGDGPDFDKINDSIKSLGLENNVLLKGVTNSPKEVLSKARFFVLSSDFEGIPNALIEAMSIGLPSISTDCRPGGAALLIEDKVNGLLVPCGEERALSEAMACIADSPDKANDMGTQAKKIKEKFSEEKVINMWCNYISGGGKYVTSLSLCKCSEYTFRKVA